MPPHSNHTLHTRRLALTAGLRPEKGRFRCLSLVVPNGNTCIQPEFSAATPCDSSDLRQSRLDTVWYLNNPLGVQFYFVPYSLLLQLEFTLWGTHTHRDHPLIDYAFKMLFGSEKRKAITIRFTNDILDVVAEDVLGRKFNIEARIALPAGMAERMVFYTAETYVRRLQQGQNYSDLLPSISICVLAGALISQPAKLHLDFRLCEESLPLTLTDDLQIHFLQLNHLQVTAETLYHASPVERWCWFLRAD